jgi:RNA polymerase sigma-70 factor (ECF subfamily)
MKEFDKKYRKSIEKFVSQKIEDMGLVEEITNDVLWSAWESRENFNHKCEEFSWICSIAKHKIIDYYRKKKIKQVLFSNNPIYEEIADKALTPERDVLKNELKEEIKNTFMELNEGYGKLLRLKYIDGLKIKEISSILKISLKAVESRLSRAKKQFREAWNYDRKEI